MYIEIDGKIYRNRLIDIQKWMDRYIEIDGQICRNRWIDMYRSIWIDIYRNKTIKIDGKIYRNRWIVYRNRLIDIQKWMDRYIDING